MMDIDVNNVITGIELEHLLKLQLASLAKDPKLAKVLPPTMVWGAPGLGKSSILKKVAKDMGIGFIDVRLAQREPVDIRGLPVPKGDRVEWLVSADWPRDPDSKGIILFDEITAADRSLQVAAYEFILDRRLGDLYQVPDGWYICAAGNRAADRAVAMTMSSALANRFMHVELTEDAESWVAWALTADIRPEVIGYIRYRPDMLFNQKMENLERGWPSPRSWERVSRMLDVMANEDQNLVRKMVFGLVGPGAGTEFMEYMKSAPVYKEVLAVMTDPSKDLVLPEKISEKYAYCSAAAYYLWRGKDESDAARRMDGFYRICMAMTSDFATMMMTDASKGNADIEKTEACRRLLHHPSAREWAAKHGKAFRL